MATIADVARAAGVSTSTVSYVLSGRRPISASTRARVQESIAALGYRPHAGARALASRQTNVLALVAPLRADINVPVIMQFVTAVVTAARRYDHDVLLLTNDEGAPGLDRVAGGAMVDALIVMDVARDDSRLDVLRRLRQPAVLIGLPDQPAGLSCVDLDFAAAGYLSVQHLAELGHRNIALIGPPAAVYQRETSYATRFLTGFREAAARFGITAVTHPCHPGFDAVRRCLQQIDDEPTRTTALIVHNEWALAPLLSILASSGRAVPQEMSIVAICPEDVALGLEVHATSVDIPARQIGELAVDMVMQLLAGGRGAQSHLVSPFITVRDSSTAPSTRTP